MASNLNLSLNLTGSGTLTGAVGLTTPTSPINFGQGTFPPMALSLAFGTGNNQAKTWYAALRTIGAGLNDDLDLAGSLNNELGDNGIVFLSIKLLLIAIQNPDGVKKLRVGPQGVTNPFQGPHGGVVAGNYLTVDNWCPVINSPWGGFAVAAGTGDILRVNNPGAAPVTYGVLIVGTT